MSLFGHRGRRVALTLLCTAAVPLIVIVLVRWLFAVPLSSFRPVLNDEVAYWHQTLTFTRTGFHGGYYTLGELTNASGFTPFGPHGPGFAMAYGMFGKALGWHRHSVVVLNLVLIACAGWLWTAVARLNTSRLALSALLLLTFWHMVFWAPTGMQEGLHHAGAIAMAAFFAHALDEHRRRWIVAAGWVVLGALAFIRPSWVVMLPFWALTAIRPRSLGRALAAVAFGSLLAIGVVIAYSRTTAPFPAGFFFLKALDLTLGVRAVSDNVLFNLRRSLAFGEYTPIEILHRLQYWSLTATALVIAGIGLWRLRRGRTGSSPTPHLLVSAAVMAAALFFMVVLYTLTNWAEHRVLSAFLLFGVLLPIAAPTRIALLLPAAMVISNIVTTPLFLHAFEGNRHDNFVWDRRGTYALASTVDPTLVYRPSDSRWCNTLLTSQYPPYLIAVPAGIGLSVVREPELMSLPPRSGYLLLDDRARTSFSRPLALQALAEMPYGTLYRNLESGCR
jgi:hypothetical protein